MIEWLQEQLEDINPSALIIAAVTYLGLLFWLWKLPSGDVVRIHIKILLSVFGLPLFYILVKFQLDR